MINGYEIKRKIDDNTVGKVDQTIQRNELTET